MSVPPEKPKGESEAKVPKKEPSESTTLFDASAECKKWLGVVFKNEKELMAVLQELNRPPKDKVELIELIMQRRSNKLDEALALAEDDIRRGSALY